MITNDNNNNDVLLSDKILIQVDCFSYLGVKLDAHWNEQVDDVCKKLAFMVYITNPNNAYHYNYYYYQ